MPLLPFSSAPTGDATNSVKGKIKLAGDLGGTADLPTVTGLSGKVTGPSSATDNAIARYDGTTGRLIQNSSTSTIADDGSVVLASDVTPLTAQKVTQGGNLFYTMTANSTTISPNAAPFIASASTEANANNAAWKAFDRIATGIGTIKWTSTAGFPQWVKYNFNTSGGAKGYYYKVTGCIVGQETLAIKTWTFEGSNDDAAWTVLDTQTNAPVWTGLEARMYAIATPGRYQYYRLNISANQGSATGTTVLELALLPQGELLKSAVAQTQLNGGETDNNTMLLTTSSREFVLEETGDLYGTVRMRLQARFGNTGALFENTALDLVDFAFQGSSATQGNLRWEHRPGTVLTSNTAGEFKLFSAPAASNTFFIAGNGETRIVSTNVNYQKAIAGSGPIFRVANTQATGAAQFARMVVEADLTTPLQAQFQQLSSSWVTSGVDFASGASLEAKASGGLSIAATDAAGTLRLYTGGTTLRAQVDSSGKLAIGNITPTAFLHLLAGTASANTAPLKLTSGTSLTTPEAGAIEYDGSNLYHTTGSLARRALVGCIFTQTADQTVTNTVTETTIIGSGVGYGLTLPTNFFVAGKTLRLRVGGIYSTPALGASVTVKIKYGSTVLASVATTSLLGGASNLEFDGEVSITCRTTGTTGTVMTHGDIEYATGVGGTIAVNPLNNAGAATTINTTTSNLLDVTVTWDGASTDRIVKSTVTTVEVVN